MRVLLVEDDSTLAQSVELMLMKADMQVDRVELGEDALNDAKVYQYDLILLDLNLPDMNGFEVLRSLRLAKDATPVMVLSGLMETDSKVKAFNAGADDYMTKPFQTDELVARIHAIVRRSQGHAQSTIQIGGLVVNMDAKTLAVDGNEVRLTRKEYQIVELLAMRKGTTLTKEMLLNHLYNGLDEPELKIIDVFLCKIRKKIADVTGVKDAGYIETVWGRGYMLREPAAQPARATAAA